MGKHLKPQIKILGLLVVALFSRLPFIFAGAGSDADAWRILLSGHSLATTGIYCASRLPGYPIPEIVASFFWIFHTGAGGYWVVNLFTAMVSTLAVYFFYKILAACFPDRVNVNLGASLALAFTPVFYIASTTTMDYVWAITGVLGAIYCALNNERAASAVLLALATGCRITSGLFLLPLILFLLPKNRKVIIQYIGIYTAIALLPFAPLWTQLGFGFLKYEAGGYPVISVVLGRAFIRVWGIAGSFGLLLALMLVIKENGWKVFAKSGLFQRQKDVICFSGLSIFIYVLLFIKIPLDAGYLIPVIPFTILILTVFIKRKSIYFVLGLFVLSSFVLDMQEQKIVIQGSIFSDHTKRKNEMEFAKEVLLSKSHDRTPELIICKAHLPIISVMKLKSNIFIPPEKQFIYEISGDVVKNYYNKGQMTISYLRDCY
jgi:hypothetical protein